VSVGEETSKQKAEHFLTSSLSVGLKQKIIWILRIFFPIEIMFESEDDYSFVILTRSNKKFTVKFRQKKLINKIISSIQNSKACKLWKKGMKKLLLRRIFSYENFTKFLK
jgi:hypothetical protein